MGYLRKQVGYQIFDLSTSILLKRNFFRECGPIEGGDIRENKSFLVQIGWL